MFGFIVAFSYILSMKRFLLLTAFISLIAMSACRPSGSSTKETKEPETVTSTISTDTTNVDTTSSTVTQ